MVVGNSRGAWRLFVAVATLTLTLGCGGPTAGGTEANNTVLTPDWRFGSEFVDLTTLFVGATEHPSVLAGGGFADDEIRVHFQPKVDLLDKSGTRMTGVEALAQT